LLKSSGNQMWVYIEQGKQQQRRSKPVQRQDKEPARLELSKPIIATSLGKNCPGLNNLSYRAVETESQRNRATDTHI